MRQTLIALAAAAVIALAGAEARADVIVLGTVSQSGQGIGAVTTAISILNNTGATAQGSVTPTGVTGNAQQGANSSTLFNLSGVGAANASQLRLILNINESDDELSVDSLRINVYNSSGLLVGSVGSNIGDLDELNGGVGGSGIVLGLDGPQAAQLQTFITSAGPNYQLGLSVALSGLNGGIDVIQVGAANPVPEPTAMLLLGTGLATIAAKARRRRKV